jgi:aspartate/methionine/tyrosine aminotransferase
MNNKIALSKAAYRIEGQPMFKVLDKVRKIESLGEKIIHFEIGDPDFDTPKHIVEAAYRSMKNKETHYTSSMGLYDMRVAASEVTGFSRRFTPPVEQVLITPGANIIIYLAVKCLVNPGEEIICPDPGFPTYYSVAKLCNVIPNRVPLRESNGFRMNPEDVKKAITRKTRMIIINSPNNPTGSVMTSAEMDEIYDMAASRNIFLYSDEIYSRMIYGNTRFYSPSLRDKCKKITIVANGFSKAFAMTGWRLGVAIAPQEVIDKMGLLVQTICSCVPPFIQRAGIAALKEDQSEIRKMMQVYKERRDILVDGLNKICGISCLKSEGAFYVFPNISKTGLTSEKFSDLMLSKAKVALLPGTNFGKYGKGYVRLTYATSLGNIKEGLKRMGRVLN